MIYLVMEACKSSLLGKAAEMHAAALIPADYVHYFAI
jgi:hypothetical protein